MTVTVFSACLILVRRARELLFALEGERLSLPHSQIGYVTALSFAVDGIMFPVAGRMLDRLGRIPTGVCSMLGLGISIALLLVDSFEFYIAFAVVSGLFNGISSGIVQIMAADLAPPNCRSQFIGVFRTLAKCADIVAPAVIGGVAQLTCLKTAEVVVASVSLLGSIW